MLTEPAFNAIANTYDIDFTRSTIGVLQRKLVWKYLKPYLSKKKLSILEINCGSGIDGIRLAKQGHAVKATDISDKMIKCAQLNLFKENANLPIAFEICSFENIKQKYKGQKFDLIFSNFAGLNCIDKIQLEQLNNDLHTLLHPGGKLIIVLLGKYCLMERMYFLLKGNFLLMSRRTRPAQAQLSEHSTQATWYYTSTELQQIFSSFKLKTKKPIGLFVPPSYLEKQVNKHPVFLKVLIFFDKLLGNMSSLANFGDHIYLVFEKK